MGSMVPTQKGSALAKFHDDPVEIETGQFLTFMLGGETYALKILNIREIIQFGDLTPVPMMPNFIRGVINLRGKVVPVIDLTARFGRGLTSVARRTSVIIVELNQDEESGPLFIGVMVDAVNEVVEISLEEIESTPAFGAKIRSDFISGMAKHNGRFIVVLNLERVLSIEEMAALSGSLFGSSESTALAVLEAENVN